MTGLTISEKIAVSNYLLKNTEESKLRQIIEEILKDRSPKNIYPPIEFIIEQVCDYYHISVDEFKSNCRKKEFGYARMIGAKIITDLHIKPGKNNKLYIRKKFADQLSMKSEKVQYLIRKAKNFLAIYRCVENEITYLSTSILWKYLKQTENE